MKKYHKVDGIPTVEYMQFCSGNVYLKRNQHNYFIGLKFEMFNCQLMFLFLRAPTTDSRFLNC